MRNRDIDVIVFRRLQVEVDNLEVRPVLRVTDGVSFGHVCARWSLRIYSVLLGPVIANVHIPSDRAYIIDDQVHGLITQC